MIGGDDLLVEGPTTMSDVDLALRMLMRKWREAVIEDDRGRVHMSSDPDLWPLPRINELFVYRDQASFDSWKSEGLTDENAEAVVWISIQTDAISFVMNDRESPTGRVVQEVTEAITRNRRWLGYASVKRAA